MYGEGHRYCRRCGHAVRSGRRGCGNCRATFAELMLLDDAIDQGLADTGIGFDPFDGQFAVDIPGTDLAIEPDGQIDFNDGGIDIPFF